jgi:hypothetical protein
VHEYDPVLGRKVDRYLSFPLCFVLIFPSVDI